MYNYSLTQWVLFFFWYCFLGWIWECFYVSVKRAWKKKKFQFINRGFRHGPFIPIYGEHIQLPEFENLPDRQELLDKLELHRRSIREKSNKQFVRALNQLKRNPGVNSKKYQEALDMLNELFKKHD